MKFLNKNTIKLDKVLNELDKFVLKFVRILESHVDYVIVSGYVSILLGRSRATEDIPIFIKEMSRVQFEKLYNELKKQGYWCLNAEDVEEVYSYLEEGLAIRFSIEGRTIPNFKVKFARRKLLDLSTFDDFIKVITIEGEVKISSLERQIAFKKYYLKSDKDLEDAAHIEETFKNYIDINKITEYKRLIEDEKKRF